MSQILTQRKTASMKRKRLAGNIATYTALTVLSIIWIIPLIWMILQSLAGEYIEIVNEAGQTEQVLNTYSRLEFIPSTYGFHWFKLLFTSKELPYWRWFLNTLIVSAVCFFVSTFFTISMAYVMSRYRFKARKKLQSVGLILGMFPGFMSMTAVYFILKAVGLAGDVDTWKKMVALILVYSGSAGLGYYVSKGFFDTISKSLDEAARIDGATNSQVFFKIVLPLAKPILVYTALMSFLGPWGDFIFAKLLLQEDPNCWTVSVGLYNIITTNSYKENYYHMFMAGAVTVAVPITILFICLQRYFVEGITGGAVKG